MAGIHVSGGTYSGSGDVTTDWMRIDNSGTAYLPDGTLDITSENDAYAFYCASALEGVLYSQSGTLKISTNTNTRIRNQSSQDAWHNVIIDTTGYTTSYRYTVKENTGDLTIVSGATFDNSQPESYLVHWDGNVLVSGTLDFWTNASYRPNLVEFGSLHIAAGGTYNATSGNTTINWSDSRSSIWDQRTYKNDGTMIHNSGTLILNPDSDPVFGGGTGSGGLWNVIATEAGGNPTYRAYNTPIIGNDLTVSGTLTYGNNVGGGKNHTVSGNVMVISGASYANTGATANTQSFGSLYIDDTATFIASPAGNLNFYYTSDGFSLNNEGTFTHNDGTVKIDFENGGAPGSARTGYNSDSKVRCASGDLYNLEVEMNRNGDATKIYPPAGSENMIENDLTITKGTFYKYNDNYTLIVSGTVTTAASSTFGLASATANDTIGEISNTGTYVATSGTTNITAGNFTDDGTMTHNNGTFSVKAGHAALILGASETAFYDIKSASEGSGVSTFKQYTNKIVEHDMITGSKELQWQLVADGVKLTLGTTSYASQIDADYFDGGGAGTQYVYSASELKPAVFKSSIQFLRYMGHPGQAGYMAANAHVKWVDVQKDITTPGASKKLILDGNSEFDAVTIAATDNLMASGQRVTFGGTMTTAADGLTISGALVEMKGAGNWSETGYQQFMGRNSASVIWNSTGFYSPNGGYLNYGWENALWNAEARVNQDSVFRNTNLIVAGGLDANNRAIGTSGSPTNIKIANGGTISSSTNTFHASNFSNRGGLFTSSSAVEITGSAASSTDFSYINVPYNLSSLSGDATIELWINADIQANSSGGLVNGYPGTNRWQMYYETSQQITFYSHENNRYLQFSCPAGKWQHIAITFNNTTQECNGYLNGKLVDNTNLGSGINLAVSGVNPDIGINWQNAGKTTVRTGQQMFDGRVGMFRLFNSERTAAQIKNDMFNAHGDMADTTNLAIMYQFDEGEGTSIKNVDDVGTYDATLSGVTIPNWTTAGTWEQNIIGTETDVYNGNLYIGTNTTTPTMFSSSYFNIANRKLIEGSKFVSKSHMGTLNYYIATSGTNDWLNYQHLTAAPIGTTSEVYILANGALRSYFNFDSDANNEQCNTLVNAGVVRIVANSDFYTQDFDNSQGEWIRSTTYDGIIHDDGSTPHEYEPIDIMDDQDSFFDTEDLID